METDLPHLLAHFYADNKCAYLQGIASGRATISIPAKFMNIFIKYFEYEDGIISLTYSFGKNPGYANFWVEEKKLESFTKKLNGVVKFLIKHNVLEEI